MNTAATDALMTDARAMMIMKTTAPNTGQTTTAALTAGHRENTGTQNVTHTGRTTNTALADVTTTGAVVIVMVVERIVMARMATRAMRFAKTETSTRNTGIIIAQAIHAFSQKQTRESRIVPQDAQQEDA